MGLRSLNIALHVGLRSPNTVRSRSHRQASKGHGHLDRPMQQEILQTGKLPEGLQVRERKNERWADT